VARTLVWVVLAPVGVTFKTRFKFVDNTGGKPPVPGCKVVVPT
jgi:hypothetical protein